MGGWVDSGWNGGAHRRRRIANTGRAGLDLICKRRWHQLNKMVCSEASLKKEGCAPYRIEVRCEGEDGANP